ncbi:MAG TPA: radical SAM protein [Longilinea sp.]|nr:radical SAM protein [Longilinea sp.]
MVILGTWHGRPFTLSLKPNCTTFSIETDSSSDVYSFDLSGRLWTAKIENIAYRRGLDGRVLSKWSTISTEHDIRWLEEQEASTFVSAAYLMIQTFLADLSTTKIIFQQQPVLEELENVLRKITGYTQDQLAHDAAAFTRLYGRTGILPPDQYMAVFLQVTEGCTYNQCTFCHFYKDRPFRAKPFNEFEVHAKQVKAYLGEGISLRRTIFLGDANSLALSTKRLLPYFDIIHRYYDIDKLGGIYAFLDGFNAAKKTLEDYRALADRGLKGVFFGLESGSQTILDQLNKPIDLDEAVPAIHTMKQAGLDIGVIILLGAGGKELAQEHATATIRVLNAMKLDADDLIYYSELVESDTLGKSKPDYTQLSHPEMLAQADQILDGLVFSEEGGTPHISRYDIREFIY